MPQLTSAVCWIPSGACASTPRRTALDPSEIQRMSEIAGLEHADALQDLKQYKIDHHQDSDERMDVDENTNHIVGVEDDDKDVLKTYNLDSYDAEPCSVIECPLFYNYFRLAILMFKDIAANIFSSMKSMVYHSEDPNDVYVIQNEDDENDQHDLMIGPTDSILVCASTSDDVSVLEFQVLEGLTDDDIQHNLYTHHDIMLPTFSLAIEWFHHVPGTASANPSSAHHDQTRGSFVAVAGFHGDIEVWEVDVVDTILPLAILGNRPTTSTTPTATKKKKQNTCANPEFHTDSVLALSWNSCQPNFLASGSADSTVKIWDLNSYKAIRSFTPHASSKVCITKWNPVAPTCMVTGAYDQTLQYFDTRTPTNQTSVPLCSDPESVQFQDEKRLFVGLENGHINLIDLRNASKPVWTLAAHVPSPCSDMSLMSGGGTLASVGADQHVKIWSVVANPTLLHSRSALNLGPLFACAWCPDQDQVLAVAGARGSLVLDFATNAVLRPNGAGGAASDDDESGSDSD